MDNTPLFSILMANHNRANYLAEAIESVIQQSYSNWELIIWDDHSSDHSMEIIRNYQKKENRIRVFENNTNLGAGYTKANLVKVADGIIAAFFDSDDVLVNSAIETMVHEHLLHPDYAMIYSNHYVCDEQLNILKKGSSRKIPFGESHLTYFGISHFATFKLSNYFKTNGIDERLTKAVDQDLYYQLEETGKVYYIDRCLYYYRNTPQSISLNKNKTIASQNKWELILKSVDRRKKSNSKVKYPTNNQLIWMEFEIKNGKNYPKFILQNPIKNSIILFQYILSQINLKIKTYF